MPDAARPSSDSSALPARVRPGVLRPVLALLTALLGGLALAGWLLRIPTLTSFLPGLATMKFNTGLSFVLAGASLGLYGRPSRRAQGAAVVAAAAVVVLAALSISQDVMGWKLGIDELVVRDPATPAGAFPGRMSVATSLCFLLTGTALLGLHRGRLRLAQVLAFAALCLGLFALSGYLYAFEQLYALSAFSSMALHTAVAFSLLSTGLLSASSGRGVLAAFAGEAPGSLIARRVWLPLVITTVVVGGLVEGGERAGLLGSHLDTAVLVAFLLVVATGMIWWGAHSLNRLHAQTLRLNRLYAALSHCNQSIVHLHDRTRLFEEICRGLVRLGGFRMAWVGVPDEDRGVVLPAAQAGAEHDVLVQARLAARAAAEAPDAADEAVAQGRAVVRRHAASRVATAPWQAFLAAHACTASAAYPLTLDGRTVGTLAVYAADGRAFQQPERELLDEVASDVSLALTRLEMETRRVAAERDAAYLAALVASSDDAIVGEDLDGRVTSWNAGAEHLLGFTAAEMIGTPIARIIPPEEQHLKEELLRTRIRRGERVENFETTRLHRQGHRVAVSISYSPIKDASGTVIGVSKIARDITEQKHLEQAQRAAQQATEEANRIKSIILANMSHEIRTPLTAIVGFAEVLAGQLEGTQRSFAENIVHGGRRLTETLVSIITLAELEAQQQAHTLRPLDVAREVRDLTALMQGKAPQRGLSLTLHVAPEAETASALLHRGALTSILQNLIGNALKFTHEGGVTVTVTLDAAARAGIPGPWIAVEVADTGIGIAPAFLDRMFEPFTQESTGTSRTYEGSGLGLPIAAQLVERMGGILSVESEQGRGSRFTVRFPLLGGGGGLA